MVFSGKTGVVTGAGQGIGKAVAAGLLRRGMRVIIAEADEEAGRSAQEELSRDGEVAFVRTDVSREDEAARMAEAAVSRFGGIDLLVNNAGVFGGHPGPLEQLSLEEWNRVIGTNLTGTFLCAKHCAPHLRKTKGSIVNVASTRALMSEPHTEPYSASKGGVVALTHALAISLGPDVRVNCVSPGWIETGPWKKPGVRGEPELREVDHRQHPAGRVGRPQDVVEAVVFLAANGFMTGADIVIDGGMTRKMIYAQ